LIDSVPLSPRQKEVYLLLAFGNNQIAIAERLNVSQHTIYDYIKETYSRLAVHTRDQLLDKLKASILV
jgi:DNA-binding CsgD family transcriptional regulator